MKFVEHFQEEDFVRQSETSMVDRNGKSTENEKEVFAKSIAIDIGNNVKQNKYFLKTHNNVPYDPNGPYSHRESYLRTELKSVSKETFENYVIYLKTKNLIYMTKTQRGYING